MKELFRFVHHIVKVGNADGGKRVFYAVLHIFGIALAFAAGFGAYWLISNFGDLLSKNFLTILIVIPGIIVCVAAAILFFLQGVVAQFATIIFCAVGIKDPEQRGGNVLALIIAVLGFAAVAVILVVLFTTVL